MRGVTTVVGPSVTSPKTKTAAIPATCPAARIFRTVVA